MLFFRVERHLALVAGKARQALYLPCGGGGDGGGRCVPSTARLWQLGSWLASAADHHGGEWVCRLCDTHASTRHHSCRPRLVVKLLQHSPDADALPQRKPQPFPRTPQRPSQLLISPSQDTSEADCSSVCHESSCSFRRSARICFAAAHLPVSARDPRAPKMLEICVVAEEFALVVQSKQTPNIPPANPFKFQMPPPQAFPPREDCIFPSHVSVERCWAAMVCRAVQERF